MAGRKSAATSRKKEPKSVSLENLVSGPLSSLRVIGLDLGLRYTGVVYRGVTLIHRDTIRYSIRPKASVRDRIARLHYITEQLMRSVMYIREKFGGYEWVVGIEGYAMRATGRTFCIAELGGSIKRTLFDAGFPIYVIPPKAARALVFGHGGIDKEQVHDLVRRALGVDTDPRSMWTSDEADAYVVMRAVEMLHSSSERLSIPHRRLAIKLLKAHGELK